MVALAVIRDDIFKLVTHKSWRSGQVYHILLPRKAYYSSEVNRVCVASEYISSVSGHMLCNTYIVAQFEVYALFCFEAVDLGTKTARKLATYARD